MNDGLLKTREGRALLQSLQPRFAARRLALSLRRAAIVADHAFANGAGS